MCTRLISILAFCAATLCAAVPANSQAYHLTFDEEFNKLTLSNQDTYGDSGTLQAGRYETWYRSHPSRHLITGEQEEFVDPSFYGIPAQKAVPLGLNPFSVHDGVATLEGDPAPPADYPFLDNQKYVSGLLTTYSSFSQTYGYFECRARLPRGPGLWPAFWMLPTTLLPGGDLKWQYEIDIFECFGSQTPSGGGANQVHWALHDVKGGGGFATVPGNIYEGYHTYGVDWEPYPGDVTYYFDGNQIGRLATHKNMNQPMFLIECLTLGGTWMGFVDPASGEFPAKMQISYIRAYSKDPHARQAAPENGYSPGSTLPILVVDSGPEMSASGVAPAAATTSWWTTEKSLRVRTTDMGFEFNVSSGDVGRSLEVYVGAQNTTARLSVSDADGRLVAQDTEVIAGPERLEYTLSLRAGEDVTVNWTKLSSQGSISVIGSRMRNQENTAGPATGAYRMHSCSAEKTDLIGQGTMAVLGNAPQEWLLTNISGAYFTVSPRSDPGESLTFSPSQVTLSPKTQRADQLWELVANIDGSYRLCPAQARELALAVEGDSIGNGNVAQTQRYDGGRNQNWELEHVN